MSEAGKALSIIIDPEFRDLIPPLNEEERKNLEESLVKDGCRDALVVWDGVLVDGHNRYEICQAHGIPFKTVNKEFCSRNEAMLWMIQNQLSRRNLDPFDRITLAMKQKPILEEIARARQSEAGGDRKSEMYKTAFARTDNSDLKQQPEQTQNPTAAFFADLFGLDSASEEALADNSEVIGENNEDPEEMLDCLLRESECKPKPEAELATKKKPVHVREEIARLANVSTGTVAKFEQIQKKKPELADDIRNHKLSIDGAYKQIKQEEKEQSRAERDKVIAEQISRPSSDNHVDIYTTDRKYRVIYADPPWSYGDKQNIDGLGGAEKHYPTMPLADICALPVPAEENAVLFLWVTSPMLEDCFKVINAWGFKYKSSFVWDKVAHNMGHYNSVRHEFLLVCTRGSCTPDVKKLYDSVQSIERTEHSRKPAEFREIIDTIYPSGRRLEMFAREAPAGWDVWGNMA